MASQYVRQSRTWVDGTTPGGIPVALVDVEVGNVELVLDDVDRHAALGAPLDVEPFLRSEIWLSYGSLTTGLALQHDTPVRDAVVFGSPGLDISQRSDLLVQSGHMHSMWSDQDSVPKLDIANHFGVSPYKDLGGGMGIDQLSTGDATSADGQHLSATHEHSQYLDNNSTSQYNMASVVSGRPDLRIGYIPAVDAPTPPPTSGQPIPAPPGRVPQPPPR